MSSCCNLVILPLCSRVLGLEPIYFGQLRRGASTFVVVLGVMVYSVGKKLQEDSQQRHQKEGSQHELTLVAEGEESSAFNPAANRRTTWSDKVQKALKSYSVEPEAEGPGETDTLLNGDANPT